MYTLTFPKKRLKHILHTSSYSKCLWFIQIFIQEVDALNLLKKRNEIILKKLIVLKILSLLSYTKNVRNYTQIFCASSADQGGHSSSRVVVETDGVKHFNVYVGGIFGISDWKCCSSIILRRLKSSPQQRLPPKLGHATTLKTLWYQLSFKRSCHDAYTLCQL